MPDIAPNTSVHPGNDPVLCALWNVPGVLDVLEKDVARISTDTGFIVPHCPRNDKGGNKGRGV